MCRVNMMLGVVLLLSGCGSLPDVKVRYYLPKSTVLVTVNHTAMCVKNDGEEWDSFVYSDIAFETEYSADNSAPMHTVNLANLDAWHGKSDITFSLTEDGRLKEVNGENTGQLESYLKAAATSITSILSDDEVNISKPACEVLDEHNRAKDGKPTGSRVLSIKLVGRADFNSDDFKNKKVKIIIANPANISKPEYNAMAEIFGKTFVEVSEPIDSKEANSDEMIGFDEENFNGETLKFLRPALSTVTTKIKGGKNPLERSQNVPVPQAGTPYFLPLQKPPLFGTNSIKVSVSPAGMITILKYGSDASTAAGLNTLNEAYSSLAVDSAEKAAALKAEADLIVQRERLLACKLVPSECS
jgi:hypothetical protein